MTLNDREIEEVESFNYVDAGEDTSVFGEESENHGWPSTCSEGPGAAEHYNGEQN